MTIQFDGLLPPGWTAQPQSHRSNVNAIRDTGGGQVRSCQVDQFMPLEIHVRNMWWRHIFPDAPPRLFMRVC